MKIKTTLLAAMALGASGLATADVTITIPDTVEVLVANDSKPELSGSFFSASKTLTLPDGENQILFRYKPYFDQGKDRIILESDPTVATFNQANTELEFVLPKYRNANQASKSIQNLEWDLATASGQTIEVNKDTLVKDGMQIGRNLQIELAEYNRKGGVAAVSSAAVVPVTLPAKTSEQATADIKTKKTDNTAEEMLHFWYSKADAETKARFKAFVNQ